MTSKPYELEEQDGAVVVRFPSHVHLPLTPQHEAELTALIRESKPVIVDFSSSRVLGTRWLRLVQRLSIMADNMGKKVAVVGLDPVLREKADLIAISKDLHVYDTLDAVPRQ